MTTDNDAETLPQRSLSRTEPRAEIVAGAKVMPLVPRNIEEVLRFARMILLAGAVPDSLTKENGRQLPDNEVVARVVAVIAAGSEVGLAPMSAMASIALINKRRLIFGQGAIAILQASGQLEDMKVDRIGQQPGDEHQTAQFADSFGVRVSLKRKGQPTPFVGEFTVGMARRAHLWGNVNKKPWIEHPERMLFWRSLQVAAANGFSDCLVGLGIREAFDEPAPQTQITDTSFLDAPRKEVVPDTELRTGDNTTPPVDAGGEPSPEPEATVAPPPARRRARRRREDTATDMFQRGEPQHDPAAYEPDEDNEPSPEDGNDR